MKLWKWKTVSSDATFTRRPFSNNLICNHFIWLWIKRVHQIFKKNTIFNLAIGIEGSKWCCWTCCASQETVLRTLPKTLISHNVDILHSFKWKKRIVYTFSTSKTHKTYWEPQNENSVVSLAPFGFGPSICARKASGYRVDLGTEHVFVELGKSEAL